MLDIKFIRENSQKIKEVLKNRRADVNVEKLLKLDEEKRELNTKVDELRQQRNEAAKNRDIEKGKLLKQELEGLEEKLSQLTKAVNDLLVVIPNIYSDDTPIGLDDSENKVLRKWGEIKECNFEPKDHVELGELLGIIDIETAGKVSGTRFNYLKGELVTLQFALITYTMSILQNEKVLQEIASKTGVSPKPFIPVLPPVMIKPEVYRRAARLDHTNEEEKYHFQKDDIYLIGSAEHTLAPLHMDQIIEEKDLPLRYVGYSTAFRREAGSYGKDTRGILRVHQFDKIELESFSLPEDALKEQDFIVALQEYLMQSLNLPYQVVIVCTGDMGTPDFRQIDIETWMPAQNKYRETHSSDYNTDFQSRGLDIKVRRKNGNVELVHMNDATAFALGRIIIAILENYQQEDGSVKIPEVLIPYTGFSEIKPKN